MILNVESSTAPSGELQPTGFFLGDSHVDVIEIVDQWPSIDNVYFKVQAMDGSTYILKYDEKPDQWEMTFFEAPHLLDELQKSSGNYLN
ncbi:MAG: hypothetical protein ACXU8A_05730 [Burkholderiaceae bacterium]